MYKRQLVYTLGIVILCLTLVGAGFFSLYYQYHLQDLKAIIERNSEDIRSYAYSSLHDESELSGERFHHYLSSVSAISETTILLCEPDGSLIYATPNSALLSGTSSKVIPDWAVSNALEKKEFPGLTTFNGFFSDSCYVSGLPIVVSYISPFEVGEIYQTVGILFIATDASSVRDFLASGLQVFLVSAAAVLLFSLFVAAAYAQHAVRPLKTMSLAADRFAHGDLDVRVPASGTDEIADLARSFNKMADALALSEKRRSDFVANVSHELKTPMTTIAGFADGILDGTIPPERETESLEIISSETRRLSRLVRRMLELSRLQSQERVAAQVQFDVGEILLRVLVSLEAKVTEKNLEVSAELPDEGAMVWGDPDAITQVCYNLLDNAIKFSNNGGMLTISINSLHGKAHVSIKNQGATIPPEQLTDIFDRFQKADSSRTSKDGVGLGLYIVKTILNTYKEDISVTSENGETEFTFTLSEV